MKTIRLLAKSRLKFHKSRTILTAIAIALTTMLLTGVATSAVGLFEMQRQQAMAAGNGHAILKKLKKEQIDHLSNHMDIESLKTDEIFATIQYEKMNGFLTYSQQIKEGIYQGVGNLIEGHMPEKENEICGPKAFFRRMNVEPVIGNTIKIDFRVGGEGKIQSREFVICGLVSERDVSKIDVSDSRIAYGAQISEVLLKKMMPEEDREYGTTIRVSGEESLNVDQIKEKIKQVAEDIGYKSEDIDFNSEYLYTVLDLGTESIGIVSGIALLIIVFSGLVIYSIYYVSVITDVQEIGKIKALGGGKRQIKYLLLIEGMTVSLFSIPLGLLLGYLIPYFILPIIMKKVAEKVVTAMPIGTIPMFSLPIFVIVTIVVFITVYLSLLKPIQMASKISPIEAIRYQESKNGKIRKGKKKVDVFGLTLANMTRNKKRTIVTMVTMGLSCVLFMSLAGVMNSMSAEDLARRTIKKGEFHIQLEYSLNDKEYPENNLNYLQVKQMFRGDFVRQIEEIGGVEKIEREKTSMILFEKNSAFSEEGERHSISPFTRDDIKKYKEELKRGELDYDKLVEENGVIFTGDAFWEEYGISIGDSFSPVIYDGMRKIPVEIKIMASIDDGGSMFLVPQELYEKWGLRQDATTDLYIFAEEKKYEDVKKVLQNMVKKEERLQLYSMDEEMQLGAMAVNMIKYPMYLVLIMVAVIGFMNLLNTMITSVVTRKRELGVLQAIGLSNRQLTKMLAGEGVVFMAGTMVAAVTLGNILGYVVFLKAKETGFMSVERYHYPIWETIGLAVMLILGQFLITIVIGKRMKKESVIDRIRSGE